MDHCHYMGLYQGPAHKLCNLRYKVSRYIPVVFYNLSGYNVHLFIRELGEKFDSGSIGVIAGNKEEYISFNIDVIMVCMRMVGVCKIKKKKIQVYGE